jgi:hypothetical protein
MYVVDALADLSTKYERPDSYQGMSFAVYFFDDWIAFRFINNKERAAEYLLLKKFIDIYQFNKQMIQNFSQ